MVEKDNEFMTDKVIDASVELIRNTLKKHSEDLEKSFKQFNNSADVNVSLKFNCKKGKFNIKTGVGFSVMKIKAVEEVEFDKDQLQLFEE